jgi:hypothetical protein
LELNTNCGRTKNPPCQKRVFCFNRKEIYDRVVLSRVAQGPFSDLAGHKVNKVEKLSLCQKKTDRFFMTVPRLDGAIPEA